jgi:hypothetical protein
LFPRGNKSPVRGGARPSLYDGCFERLDELSRLTPAARGLFSFELLIWLLFARDAL